MCVCVHVCGRECLYLICNATPYRTRLSVVRGAERYTTLRNCAACSVAERDFELDSDILIFIILSVTLKQIVNFPFQQLLYFNINTT